MRRWLGDIGEIVYSLGELFTYIPRNLGVFFFTFLNQGVLQGSANLISEKEQFVRLWGHECLRIFHDRLVDDSDRMWFNHMLVEKVRKAGRHPLANHSSSIAQAVVWRKNLEGAGKIFICH